VLPPLPPIRSAQLHEQVFTHSSLSARPRNEFEASRCDSIQDNEELDYRHSSELDGSRVMNDGRSPPVDKSLTRIFVTGDSDQYYTVDITGFRNAAFIKELIFSTV
jgi:hypothetical protein